MLLACTTVAGVPGRRHNTQKQPEEGGALWREGAPRGLPAAESPLRWCHGSLERAFAHLEQRSQACQLSYAVSEDGSCPTQDLWDSSKRRYHFNKGSSMVSKRQDAMRLQHSWMATDNSSLQPRSHRPHPATLTGGINCSSYVLEKKKKQTAKVRQSLGNSKDCSGFQLPLSDCWFFFFPISFALGNL